MSAANPSHKDQVHLASFSVIESSVPQHWPMGLILTPNASQNSLATSGQPLDSQMSPLGNDNMEDIPPHGNAHPLGSEFSGEGSLPASEAIPTGDAEQAAHKSTKSGGANDMQVDELENNEPRRSTRNIKPVNPTDNTAQVSTAPPPRKSKGKQQKNTPSIIKSEIFQSRPRVIGSKYMQVNVIDLTQVEVSQISILYF